MKVLRIIIVIIISILIGCKTKEEPCKFICDQMGVVVRVKYQDMTSNKDLLFSSNPAYTISDLKVYSSAFKQNIPFGVDSVDRSNRFILISLPSSDILTLKLANKSEDIVTVEIKDGSTGCCGSILLKRLQVNQSLICAPCNIWPEPIILSK